MKIIFSPSKKFKLQNTKFYGTIPIYQDRANSIAKELSSLSKENLGDKLKIKGKLLDETYDSYQKFNTFQSSAIHMYGGIAFKELGIDDWTPKEFKWAHDNVLILDALYGALRPLDLITWYRLDYTVGQVDNNKQYYKEKINELLKDEDEIINLASKEYSSMIEHSNIKELDTKDMHSVAAKKARGAKLREYVKKYANK